MLKKTKYALLFVLAVSIILNAGCSLSKKGKGNTEGSLAAQQVDDNSIKKLITDYIEKVYSKPVSYYQNYSATGSIPTELWDFISKDTITLSDGNPENKINYPRPVIINNMVLGNYELIKDKKGEGTPEINSQFTGSSGEVSTYFVKVNLKAKCININDLVSIIQKSIDLKTAQSILKAAASEDFTGLSTAVLNLISEKALKEMPNDVDSKSKLDYIKVQFSYEVITKKEDGKNKILSFQESPKVKGYSNRLSLYNNLPVTRLPYLDTTSNQKDTETYTKESTLITDYFNKLCASLDNEKMGLMAAYWNKSDKDFISFLEKIGKASDKKAKNLSDMMYIAGDYKTKFPYDSFPILTNMEKISGGLSNFSIKMHPAYSEKRKEYIVSFQAPVQKINGSIDGYTTNCYYDYSVSLTGKGDKLKISRMIMNEHYYLNQ